MKPSLRISILTRDRYTCQYCGRKAPDVILHVEHVRSRRDGGSDHPSNLVAACRDCNLGKGRKSLIVTDLRRQAPKDPAFFLDYEFVDPYFVSPAKRSFKALPAKYFDNLILAVDAAYNRTLQRELATEGYDDADPKVWFIDYSREMLDGAF